MPFEPEAFLHPAQQQNMAYNLRRLGSSDGQQVIVTSHSPIFVGRIADELCQVAKVRRINGASTVGQITKHQIDDVLGQGQEFKKCLAEFVDNPGVADNKKSEARRMLSNAPDDDNIAAQEERFRYQLWLDPERASMFFADRVLLVEGATEKALLGWLLARQWHELNRYRIAVIDVMGKYNFHRYIALLEAYGIPYGLLLDDDNEKSHHKAVNNMLREKVRHHCLSQPAFVPDCIEAYLDTPLPGRNDQKPVQMLKMLEAGQIAEDRLDALRNLFSTALALNQAPAAIE